jgi:hypothetical protein
MVLGVRNSLAPSENRKGNPKFARTGIETEQLQALASDGMQMVVNGHSGEEALAEAARTKPTLVNCGRASGRSASSGGAVPELASATSCYLGRAPELAAASFGVRKKHWRVASAKYDGSA